MSKRFESVSSPNFVDMLTAYQLLGIDNLLGSSGKHTAFAAGGCTDEVVFHVVPGDWTTDEFEDLLEIAVSGIAPATTPQSLAA
jgi:hypothetical protein